MLNQDYVWFSPFTVLDTELLNYDILKTIAK